MHRDKKNRRKAKKKYNSANNILLPCENGAVLCRTVIKVYIRVSTQTTHAIILLFLPGLLFVVFHSIECLVDSTLWAVSGILDQESQFLTIVCRCDLHTSAHEFTKPMFVYDAECLTFPIDHVCIYSILDFLLLLISLCLLLLLYWSK